MKATAASAAPDFLLDPARLADRLRHGDCLATGKQVLQEARVWLDQAFRDGERVGHLLHLRARFMDTLLGALWDTREWGPAEPALVAVGGYGRGELHPHSDVDILVLLHHDSEGSHPPLEQFLTQLWDIGLKVGHSVRTVDDCCRKARGDITVLTNLMESRVIRGPEALMQAVREQTGPAHIWPSADFFKAKLEEQRSRHAKYADTEYNLEPNIKTSPGGLRDLQIIAWIAERHFGVRALEEMDTGEFLTPEERQMLLRGREFMWRVRYALHMIAGREEDRLLFDHQRELAELWGFEDGQRLAVEQFMQTYYRWALQLSELNELLIRNFDQVILRAGTVDDIQVLNQDFQVRNGYIEALRDDLFSSRPGALLEVFALAGQSPDIKGIGTATIRLIRAHRHLINNSFREDPANHATFLAILRAPHQVTRNLRNMTRYGVLGNYIPAFGQIVGQMQHDLFHAYTVDAHTLEVIQHMRFFMKPEYDERFPVSSRVARRLPRIELLYLAGLFHDIGKGRGGDHSELGAEDARAFCESHGLSERDSELVTWLVRNHLLMSAVSQRKDISDPEVIQQFARHVGDQTRLDYLYTLTVADINGTNPNLWNAWRSSLLRQLYTGTKRALRRGLENPVDKQAWVEDARRAAIDLLEYRGFTAEELEDLWRERSEDYFLRERVEDIAWHTEAIANHVDRSQPLVVIRNSTDSSVANTTQIFIHAPTHAQLFSRVCTELEQLDLSINDARIYSASGGMSLDTFSVLNSDGSSIAEDGARLRHIREHLGQALAGDMNDRGCVRRITPRQMKSFSIPTETAMFVDEIKHMSVLEVASPDRPGLLAMIGRIFVDFGVVLQAAKIQTLGERVEDVFFITDDEQQPLTDPALCEAIQAEIRRQLDAQVEQT